MSEDYHGLLLKDIKQDETLIANWTRIDITEDCMLFWSHIYENPKETPGIRFKAIEWRSANDEGDQYISLIEGMGYFDGIRHLYFGDELDDSLGYIYYPNLEKIIAILKKVRELELEFLRDCKRTK